VKLITDGWKGPIGSSGSPSVASESSSRRSDEGAACLERAEHDDDRRGLERSDHRQRLVASALEQAVRDAVRQRVELGERQARVMGFERTPLSVPHDGSAERRGNRLGGGIELLADGSHLWDLSTVPPDPHIMGSGELLQRTRLSGESL
jgi:hypothetical protein